MRLGERERADRERIRALPVEERERLALAELEEHARWRGHGPHTLDEVAVRLGVSKQAVALREAKAMVMLRELVRDFAS